MHFLQAIPGIPHLSCWLALAFSLFSPTITAALSSTALMVTAIALTTHASAVPIGDPESSYAVQVGSRHVSTALFNELEELARLVDIAYCVGVSGIRPPFECVSRCGDFLGYELVDTWNTGPLLSDSCGYIAVDHTSTPAGRIIVAFRGTYSVSNTIVDLSTVPQEYVPYPGDPDDADTEFDDPPVPRGAWWDRLKRPWKWFGGKDDPEIQSVQDATDGDDNNDAFERVSKQHRSPREEGRKRPKCINCTVHSGFLQSWLNTRPVILPHITRLHNEFPDYRIHLVGHSLGGAVSALAGLELEIKGFNPTVTTFGEPRIGNVMLRDFLDRVFELGREDGEDGDEGENKKRYRRITHKDDPIPLLPLTEWGYRMHAGEIYIAKKALSPEVGDLMHCLGDEDVACIAGAERERSKFPRFKSDAIEEDVLNEFVDFENQREESHGDAWREESRTAILGGGEGREMEVGKESWGVSSRYRMWQLFFAHRDYFWRLGLCVPGGDPVGWRKHPYKLQTPVEENIGYENGRKIAEEL